MSAREFSIAVAGVAYPNPDGGNRLFEVKLCAPGELVELRLEPKNKADPAAIAVYSARGVQIGYVPADRCVWIGSKLRQGDEVDAIFQEELPQGAAIRLRIGGGWPALPPPRRLPARQWIVDEVDNFYSDPDGPTWGA